MNQTTGKEMNIRMFVNGLSAENQARFNELVRQHLGWKKLGGPKSCYWIFPGWGIVSNETAAAHMQSRGIYWQEHFNNQERGKAA